ncbi:hypothetical protein CYMTET_22583 [Cymbomonas tetramitiformis]|uniref:Uncharacterized protein n=1 Tax=Cymbomonas tetramitiformis TaxID=36881 RepID=A0AAE0FZK9_9CHLO|nr:hypothetical protein CYMTET_22583 [Cymbomonas tetramitiformis]
MKTLNARSRGRNSCDTQPAYHRTDPGGHHDFTPYQADLPRTCLIEPQALHSDGQRHEVPEANIEPACGAVVAAIGCGPPPWGLRPRFIMLACLISLICFGIVGAAAGYGGAEIDNNVDTINSITTESPVMCVGQLCLHPGFNTLSPVVQERLMQVLGSALAAGPHQGFGHDGMPAGASGYGGVTTTGDP